LIFKTKLTEYVNFSYEDYVRVDLSLSSILGFQADSVFVKAILIYYWDHEIIRDLGPNEFSVDPPRHVLPSFDSNGCLAITLRVQEPSSNHKDKPFSIRFECVDPASGIAPCISSPFRVRDPIPLAPQFDEGTEPPNFGSFYRARPTRRTQPSSRRAQPTDLREINRRVRDLSCRVDTLESLIT
jgi:hypothetical protein